MKYWRVIAGVLLMHFSGLLTIHTHASAAPLPKKPIYTNKGRFLIPFKADATALQRMNIREVQLHVSRNSGATWEMAQTMKPDGGKFIYDATTEGEYWFSVATLDAQNQVHPPAGKHETGLIVVVDFTTPTLELASSQSGPGKVQLTWKAADLNLDLSNLKVERLAADGQAWEVIPTANQSVGETTLSVVPGSVLAVRGTAADLAGNVGQGATQIQVSAAIEQPELPRQPLSGPVAEVPPVNNVAVASNEPTAPIKIPGAAPTERPYQGPVITPRYGTNQSSQTQGQIASNTHQTAPQERWASASFNPHNATSATATPVTAVPVAAAPANAAQVNAAPATVTPTQPIPQQPSSVSHQFVAAAQPQPPLATLQRLVAQRRFQIGYEMENVGPSGVGGVELFITEDGGRKWFKYGDDPDQKSPFDVEVPRDGTYGFSIRGRSGVGLGIEPPVPGESPAIIVSVDQTPPVVELFPIEQGRGPNANHVRIRWRILENYPADKPVQLQYAASLTGPWVDITSWQDDSNEGFVWAIGTGIPPQVYIRVSVRDTVGNIGTAETPSPIIIDLQRPMARIVDIGINANSVPK